MKNIQVIDGALNCCYDIFAMTDRDYALMFPGGQDIEFISDFIARVGIRKATMVCKALWKRPIDQKKIVGLHGTLFYELEFKRAYYPTKKDAEMVPQARTMARR